ncbi:TRAP transporter large permease [Parazoarcus communis]|uniref:TRAP transporter large permease protein n=1 Tax=Parazoarcus communis SWub3 = DSM 12120 TaxID=1121029 RepID=A0A323UX63_9RHOO|nr:TRAP transporter large permease [Parazoarcus communis]NMG71179.1 TRAP transporter large permease subunit [Parazoarcus communis SWub3 = DSM 12120]PZA17057.1 TRAP transporter large permease [Azoarcus communis] [Parazoarcus communis SWub3 = DSM 12120]
MEWQAALALMLGSLFVLMLIGVPVAFAFLGVNLIGAWVFLGGEAGLGQLVRNSVGSISSFSLTPIPLFVLMGEVLFHTGLAYRAIEAIERLISRVPGRLSLVSVLGGTTFATLSGSTIANTAMMGGTLLPEMLRRGYHPTLAMGPIMAVGGIAMLIPPSALAVMLGSLAGISIAQLLIGGILPGLVMSIGFLGYVVLRCRADPSLAPADENAAEYQGWARWWPFMRDVVPLLGIFVAVVGSMLAGWASPTESAAIGALAAVIATMAYRVLTLHALYKALMETARISVIILFVLVASTTFSQLLSFSGATSGLLGLITELEVSPLMLVVGMLLLLLVLGCVIDQVSMMMITLPFFMPLATAAGIDPVWLGVMMLIAMEMGLLTPPFGLLLMVMQSVAPSSIRLPQIYAAAVPFLAIELVVLALILFVPWLAVGLPRLMS